MSDTISSDSVAQDQLRAFIERLERLEEEKKAIADDIREVYAEAKGNGFSTAVMREIIRLRKKDHAERMEFEAILDLYMAALGMQAAPRDDDDFDPPPRGGPQPEHRVQTLEMSGVSEITESQPVDAPVASEADGPSGDEARQQSEPLSVPSAAQEVGTDDGAASCSSGGTESSADGQTVLVQEGGVEGEGQAGATREHGSGEPSHPLLPSDRVDETPDAPAVIAGVPNSPETATEPVTEAAGAPAIAEDASRQERAAGANSTVLSLRPHCLHPDCCGSGGGKSHCFGCRKAAWLNGVEAA